jgi:hypothetical protein
MHDFCLYEAFFHVGMDLAGGPGSRRPGRHVPGPYLGAGDGVEGYEPQQAGGLPDEAGNAGFCKT